MKIDGGIGFDAIDVDISGFDGYGGIAWNISIGNSLWSFTDIHDALVNGIDKLIFYCSWNYSNFIISNIEQYSITGTISNDLLIYSGGTRYAGRDGIDAFYADWSDATSAIVWDNDPDSTITLQGAELSGLECLLLVTGNGDDVIRNTKVNTYDYIDTGAGNDTIDAGCGYDTIYAGSGDDYIVSKNVCFIDGGSGSDTIKVDGQNGAMKIDGGIGFDAIDVDISGFDGYGGIAWNISIGNSLWSFTDIHDALVNGIDKLIFYCSWNYSNFIISNIEQYSITGTISNDLLIYSGGTRYAGRDGIDAFYADWSDATSAIVWDNDPDSTITLQGAELSGLECLLLVTGNGDDVIRNTKVNTYDYIDTGAGNDTIEAGGGNDTMIGGLGNDFYAVDSSFDVVTELASEGIDTVQSTINYILGANLENLILAGVSAIDGTGNAAGNTLVGNSGNNSISGGEGNDTIYGGEGSDTAIFTGQFVDYVIDYNSGVSAYTVVDQIANRDGTDVISSVENFQFADGTKIMTSSILDVVEPTVLSFTPPDGIDSVAIGSDIVLVFSEAIKSGLGAIAIHNGSASGPVVESYDVAMSPNLAITGNMLTINPTSDLANGTHYFVTFDASSIKDIAGNSYAGTDIYDFTTASTSSVHDISGSVTFWKTCTAIADVTSTFASDSVTTGTDGLYQHLDMEDGTYTLTCEKVSGTSESNAIKANDALAALKIAVGMNPNADGSAVSPYQYLAADVNHDGQVKAADALNILKMAVKLSTAPENEWFFVPESIGSESMSRTHVVWPENPIPVTLDVDQELHLIGIVKGDVNGSWLG